MAHARLSVQGLTRPRFRAPEGVVSFLGAMQSQEYEAAKWSLGQRCTHVERQDVEAALADGRILRTHVLRPTWHFVARADARWLLELTGPRVHAVNASRYRDLELDGRLLARSRRVFESALRDGRHLTRSQLAGCLAAVDIAASGSRLAHIVMHAELEGVLTSGAPAGRQTTYALLDERAPGADPLPRDEALARLVLRYFTGHGPASVKDCAWWSGLTITDVRRGVAAARDDLQRTELNGTELWHAGELPQRLPRRRAAHLLQTYDEYIVAYSETRYVTGSERLPDAVLGRAASFTHALVLDSQVIGWWRRSARTRDAVELKLGRPVDAEAATAIEAAVERYRAFLASAG